MNLRPSAFALGTLLALSLAAGAARAQDTDLDVERFKPAVTHDGFVTAEGAAVRPEADRWELGLYANYARNPLVIVSGAGDVRNEYVAHRLGWDVLASLTVVGPFAIGLDVPFFVPQFGDADPSVGGLGDIRLVPKVQLLDDRDLFGLALAAELRAPTHAGDFAGGARNVVFVPKIIADNRFGSSGFRLGGNVGVSLREGTEFENVQAASELVWAAALSYRFGGWQGPAALGAEFWGGAGLAATDLEELPLEGLLFAKIFPNEEWEVSFGPGMGFVAGYGVPTFRAFAGVRFRPTSHDRDHDGVADEDDQCPDVPEDLDNDHDSDGCPEEEADDDHDGVPNSDDECPDEKETINGVDDDDGCPDGGPADVIFSEGKISTVKNIEFRVNSAELDPKSHTILNQVALVLKAHPEIKHVRIEGHTDDTGPHEHNMRLSNARAASVKRYLISRGVSPSRMTTKGYGPDKPVAEGDDAEARGKNRRVEFMLEYQ